MTSWTPVEREHHGTLSEALSQPDGFTEGVGQREVRGLLADTDAGSESRCGDVFGCDPKPFGDRIGNLGGELSELTGQLTCGIDARHRVGPFVLSGALRALITVMRHSRSVAGPTFTGPRM
jgi:hypothetical protein